ncbi:hypothetical protein [Leisingera sp. M658]|uniref:hypothetical protein n=1 Tax=Leisingera sp. M658 TaxID=2867015 RepID=UPI0021A8CD60|nr:hypothetical protein [Leisingera sp. M658]UWQ77387.1 hypothetical protein K3724_22650 [Leisingera sp. M658]
MEDWPQTIPQDLKQMLEALEEYRNPPGNQDRWGAIREWLAGLGIDAPEGLAVEEELPGVDLGHSTPAR